MGFLGWMSYILHLVLAEHTSLGHQAFAVFKAGMGSSQNSPKPVEAVSLLSCGGSTVSYGVLVAICSTTVLLLYGKH